jgi:hypothetical protein
MGFCARAEEPTTSAIKMTTGANFLKADSFFFETDKYTSLLCRGG